MGDVCVLAGGSVAKLVRHKGTPKYLRCRAAQLVLYRGFSCLQAAGVPERQALGHQKKMLAFVPQFTCFTHSLLALY